MKIFMCLIAAVLFTAGCSASMKLGAYGTNTSPSTGGGTNGGGGGGGGTTSGGTTTGGSSYVAPAVTNDLSGHFDLGQASGATDGQGLGSLPEGDGSGFTAVQGTAGLQPVYHSSGGPHGAAYISFDGIDDYMVISNADLPLTGTSASIVFVARFPSAYVANGGLFSKGLDGVNHWFYETATGGGNNFFNTDFKYGGLTSGMSVGSGSNIPADTWAIHVITWNYDGVFNSNKRFLNGTASGFNSMGYGGGMPTNSNDFIIGAHESTAGVFGNYGKFDLAEMVVYDQNLSDADRETMECQLAAKYSITLDAAIVCH